MWLNLETLASTHITAIHAFTIKQQLNRLTNNSSRYWYWNLPILLLLWLVSEPCHGSMRTRQSFNGFISPQQAMPAVIHHVIDWWIWSWILQLGRWLCVNVHIVTILCVYVGIMLSWCYYCTESFLARGPLGSAVHWCNIRVTCSWPGSL